MNLEPRGRLKTSPRRVRQRYNDGKPPALSFWRDSTGNEIDLLFEVGTGLQAVEVKSGATFVRDWLRGLRRWQGLAGDQALPPWVIYGGDAGYRREGVEVIPWRGVAAAAAR